ncbi:MAG: sulfatase [Halioglobus sp.]|nr:sulfatase [Halioglobus sp.]
MIFLRSYLLIVLLILPSIVLSADRPNILLLMAEDMSARVGAFGDVVAITPRLDALAGEGVRYTGVFSTAGVCAPSRAAHILGMHQIATGTQHMRSGSYSEGAYYSVPPVQVKAYPELLRAAGYYTYTDAKLDYQFSGALAGSGPSTIWDEEWAGATSWRQRAPGQPFFGFINFAVTHESGIFRPLGSWPESPTHFVMQLMRWWQLKGSVDEVVHPHDVVLPPYYPDTPIVRADVSRHYNNIAHMDRAIGKVLDELEADGLSETTIVVWTTDHGDGLPRAKRELYDSGIRVPMIIRWPEAFRPADVQPGQVDARLISFVDIGPTILSLAGVPTPEYMHGRVFAGVQAVARDYVFASRDRIDDVMDRQRAVRDSRYKYLRSWYPEQPGGHDLDYRNNMDMVREMHSLMQAGKLNAKQQLWFEAPGKERLFDLYKDPHEINDVSDAPQYAAVLLRMRGALTDWLSRVGDWSEMSEADMAARFEPSGQRQKTPSPSTSRAHGVLTVQSDHPAHSLEYRVNSGPWQLYIKPFVVTENENIETRAVRYGWEPSDIVSNP